MCSRPLVTVVGATGTQGGAVVRALAKTGDYKIRGLTSDANKDKAQILKLLGSNIEMITWDITNEDDVQRAFKDSWAVFAVTDYWAQPDKPEAEMQQGILMADVAASLKIPYYIFSTEEDINKICNGKLNVPNCTQKSELRDYIKEKHPNLEAIYVEPGYYMQNWGSLFKTSKLQNGTVVFSLPLSQKAKLNLVDINDLGAVVREILEDPEKFVGQDICVCGEEVTFEDVPKIFTQVTGIPAISKTLTKEEFRAMFSWMSKNAQDNLLDMFKLFEDYGLYGKEKDWKSGQKLTKLNTFEEWLKKTGWRGD